MAMVKEIRRLVTRKSLAISASLRVPFCLSFNKLRVMRAAWSGPDSNIEQKKLGSKVAHHVK